jgi:hypothetical protein|nr:hypothetical protein [Neorhizobium tomejilense]
MRQYTITDTDPALLEAFEAAFHALYADKGPEASLDKDDMRHVLDLAVEGLGKPARDFLAHVSSPDVVHPVGLNTVKLSYPDDACEKVRSAAALVFSYRDPDTVSASEVDDAYAALAATDFGHSPSP